MKWLITSDLHLTDKPIDDYRFGIFPWLLQQQVHYNTDATFILGDLTDHKDRHSAVLVNKTVAGLRMLKPPIYILMGNHDYIASDNPFFDFLNQMEKIRFIKDPTFSKKYWLMMIPHQRDQASFDEAIAKTPPEAKVMMHNTLVGAFNEQKWPLSGFSGSAIESANIGVVYSGDVHRPQRLPLSKDSGIYVGSPYHIRFGDDFYPRVRLHSHDGDRDLDFKAPHKIKRTLRRRERDGNFFMMDRWASPGDHVVLTVTLRSEEVVDWPRIKDGIVHACEANKLILFGTDMVITGGVAKRLSKGAASDNNTVFEGFCETEKVPENIKQAGESLLKNV